MSQRCARCSADVAAEANYCARCGALVAAASEPDARDPLLGRVLLGRYRVVRRLGEGGMGKVYLAEQAMGQATRPVALKTLRKELMGDAKISGRFLRESEIVIRLAHPNTIQFYDFGQLDDGTLVIVMEYIEGRTLAEELRQGPLPLARVEALITQICGSLAEAHGRGIVHRDLKPGNVLLTSRAGREDFVKLVDFGIAMRHGEAGQEATRLTTQGTLIGTPPYMSPEQFQDQPVDARSDVYSLGVMLYEMLTGELPFDAKTAWQWATAHIDQAPRALADHPRARDLPAARTRAVTRALEKDRTRRPRDAAELLGDFLGLATPVAAPLDRGDTAPAGASRSLAEAVAIAPTQHAPLPTPRSRFGGLSWLPVVLLVAIGAALTWRGRVETDRSGMVPEPDPEKVPAVEHRPKRASPRKPTRPDRSQLQVRSDAGIAPELGTLTASGRADSRTEPFEQLAAVERALAAGHADVAISALRAAQLRLGADHPALAPLRTELGELVAESARRGRDPSCERMRDLRRRLAGLQMPVADEIEALLRGCPAPGNSPIDAGNNSAIEP